MRSILPALWLSCGVTLALAEEGAPAKRLGVAVLGFENKTGDPELGHWRQGFEKLLSEQLRKVKSLRQRRGKGFAFRQLGFKSGSPLDAAQAKKIGEIIEAQRVVWGSCQREGEKWQVTVRVLSVLTGNVSADLTVTAADWWGIRDGLVERLLKELGVEPSGEERRQMGKRWTKSLAALEALSKALAARDDEKPFAEIEPQARAAVLADPECPKAHAYLGAILGNQGKLAEAEEEARLALKLDPDDAESHRLLGHVLTFKGKLSDAEKEVREARRIDPDDPEPLKLLGQLSAASKKLDEALAFWEEARRLDPMDAGTHAALAGAYAAKGASDKGRASLKEAERLSSGEPGEEQRLFEAYGMFGEPAKALDHYEKFVAVARKRGINLASLKQYEELVARLKAKLEAVPVKASLPKTYTREELDSVLRHKLRKDQLQLARNPLVSSPDLKSWAMSLTQGATSDEDKAKALLKALSDRSRRHGKEAVRTALEAFAAWEKPDEVYRCQDYAKLYVAMAREIGLKAFYTIVEKDHQGNNICHACGTVFLDGKAFLVDPTCRWFGIPHQKFQILDDLEATASDLFQAEDSTRYVELCFVASRLFPDYPWGQVSLVFALMRDSRWDDARQNLEYVVKLWPDRWDVSLVEGALAAHDGKLEDAERSFRKSIGLNPTYAATHFNLAGVLRVLGKLDPALDEYRESLRWDPKPYIETESQQAILELDEQLMAAASSSVKPN